MKDNSVRMAHTAFYSFSSFSLSPLIASPTNLIIQARNLRIIFSSPFLSLLVWEGHRVLKGLEHYHALLWTMYKPFILFFHGHFIIFKNFKYCLKSVKIMSLGSSTFIGKPTISGFSIIYCIFLDSAHSGQCSLTDDGS